MADGGWKGVYPYVFGHSYRLSVNKFFDPSAPSMRKVDDGEKKRKKKIMATNVIASRPPERRPTGKLHAPANLGTSRHFHKENLDLQIDYDSLLKIRNLVDPHGGFW